MFQDLHGDLEISLELGKHAFKTDRSIYRTDGFLWDFPEAFLGRYVRLKTTNDHSFTHLTSAKMLVATFHVVICRVATFRLDHNSSSL